MDKTIKIGIGSYAFTWAIGVPGYKVAQPLSAVGLIQKAVDLQASVVQFADNMPLGSFSEKELDELFRFASGKNILLEVGSRGMTKAKLQRYIEVACHLHSDILRFVIDDAEYQPSQKEVIDIILPFVPVLESEGIYLSLENHDRLQCKEFISIIQACKSPYVGVCLDTVNSLGVPEGTEEVMKQLLPYTLNLHIKDFKIERPDHKMGFLVEGTYAGTGKLDIARLINEVKVLGRCKSAILELWTPFTETLEKTIEKENEWAKQSMDYLNQIK